jgi:phage terminase small subunit
MPRKSADALSVVRLDPRPKLPSPRKECSTEVKALFNQTLSQASKDQFRQTDDTLLELYCLAVLEARLAYQHLETEGRIISGRLSPWVSI